MIRNLKALGLALVAVFAMSAVAASGAQAVEVETAEFSWDSGTTTLEGKQDPTAPSQALTTTIGTVTCDQVSGTITVSGTGAKTIEATGIKVEDSGPKAEGKAETCTGPFGTKPAVKVNGCNVVFHAGTTSGLKAEGKGEGTVGIKCPAGKQVEFLAPGCEQFIGQQGLEEGKTLGPIFYNTTKTGSFEEVTIEAKIGHPGFTHSRGIAYSHKGFLCGTGSSTNGTYTGNITAVGRNASGNQTNFTIT